MASRQLIFMLLTAFMLGGQSKTSSCRSASSCGEDDVEAFEADEMSGLRLELLQVKQAIEDKHVKAAKAFAVPFWCTTLDDYSRSLTPSCSRAGGCGPCFGPEVCGSAPILPGSWQSYSYSCCACPYATSSATIQPPVVAPSGTNTSTVAVMCSEHPECAKLGLLGNCCPSDAGAVLDCCNQAVGSVTASPEAAVITTTPAQTPEGIRIPLWCETIPTIYRGIYSACRGGGPETGGCGCAGPAVCGSGSPIPGSWESYSSACCGCK